MSTIVLQLVPQFESDSSTIINDVIIVIICLNISRMRCCKNEKRLEVHDGGCMMGCMMRCMMGCMMRCMMCLRLSRDCPHDEVHDVFAIVAGLST